MYVFFKVSIHVQQTTQLKHYAAYNTEEGETTDNTLMTNGRRVRK